MTPRRAAALAMNLPAGAQTWVSCGYDLAWSDEAHLTAFLADAVQVGNWQRSDGKGPKPTPLPRPGDEQRASAKAAAIEARAHAFQSRQPATQQTERPRDSRGRFVKMEVS